jgi:hypothetical protein
MIVGHTDVSKCAMGQSQVMGRCCTTALPSKAEVNLRSCDVADVPCVDGSELARTFFTPAGLVGAAMCSACLCGTTRPLAIITSADQVPVNSTHSTNAMAHVGCPDRRIDRPCITCCSPSQPSHHAACSCPPLECCFGTSPIQAEKYWVRNPSPSTTRQYRFEENRSTSATTVRRAGLIGTRECRASVGTAAKRP